MKFKSLVVIFVMVFITIVNSVVAAGTKYSPSSLNVSNKENERHGGTSIAMSTFLTDKISESEIPESIFSELAKMQEAINSKHYNVAFEIEKKIEFQGYEVRAKNGDKVELYISGQYPDKEATPFAIPLSNQVEIFFLNNVPGYPGKDVWALINKADINYDEIKSQNLEVTGINNAINALVPDSNRQGCYWLNVSELDAGKYFTVVTTVHTGGMSTTMILIFKIKSKYEIVDQQAICFGVFDPTRNLTAAEEVAVQYCIGSTRSDGRDFVKTPPPVDPNQAVGPPPIESIGSPPASLESTNSNTGIVNVEFYTDYTCKIPAKGPEKISVYVNKQRTRYFQFDIRTSAGERVRKVTFNSVPIGQGTFGYIDSTGQDWDLLSRNGQQAQTGDWFWPIKTNSITVVKMYKRGGNQ